MTDAAKKSPKPVGFATKSRRWIRAWERVSVWPMFVLSVVFVVLQLVAIFYRSHLQPWEKAWTTSAIGILWVMFIVDFVLRVYGQRDRRRFVIDRWFEVLALVVPILRPVLPLYYLWRTPYFIAATPKALRLRYQITVASIAVLFLYLVSTAVYFVERGAKGATITTWPDALWWGIATITTVGYGTYMPVTFTGRLLASFTMVAGVFLIGLVSASFVSYLSDKLRALTIVHAVKDRGAYGEGVDPPAAAVLPPKPMPWAEQAAQEVRRAEARTLDIHPAGSTAQPADHLAGGVQPGSAPPPASGPAPENSAGETA